MKKSLIVLILLCVAWTTGYFIESSRSSIPDGTMQQKALYVLDNAGCVLCHTKNAEPPFYAHIPIIGTLIKHDMSEGLKHFDMGGIVNDLKKGIPTNETILAKIESTVSDASMPPFQFRFVHWSATISAPERQVILDWVKSERKRLNANSGVVEKFANEPVWPIPSKLDVDARKAELGSILYHHTALSGDNTVSCATCHPLDKGGVDGLQTSTGIRKQKGDINAPTVYNATFNTRQFWDGIAGTLEEQAGMPPLNPVEMDGVSWEKIAKRLAKDTELKKEFEKVYPDGFTEKNITDAIGAFERTLITPDSPFDKYLKGDSSALTEDQIKGYELFKAAKCSTCHSGQNLGGQTFEYMGLKKSYFNDRGNVGKINDKGLLSFTQDDRDLHKFKTPTLRNVALTAPYFHDGSTASLKQAVDIMAKYQRDKKLSDKEIEQIVKFLESLTGTIDGKPLQKN